MAKEPRMPEQEQGEEETHALLIPGHLVEAVMDNLNGLAADPHPGQVYQAYILRCTKPKTTSKLTHPHLDCGDH